MNKVAIFGHSGFALEVADICYSLGVQNIVFLSNDNNTLKEINKLSIRSESEVNTLHDEGYVFAIGIGDSLIRKKIFKKYTHLQFPNLIHPTAIFGINQKQVFDEKQGNIITPGVIFTNSIKVGDFGLYNLKVTVGHDCIIDDFVSLMPNVTISGNVHILEGAFIGTSATVLQGNIENKIMIGSTSTVGASSLVTKSVDDNVTVVGVPAKQLRI
jgi:sugar O-acyltransferase (sialic acid O-acetyltransferase NeuD family)